MHLFGFTCIGTENYSMALIDKTFYSIKKEKKECIIVLEPTICTNGYACAELFIGGLNYSLVSHTRANIYGGTMLCASPTNVVSVI